MATCTNSKRGIFILAALLALTLLPACYTLFRHPRLSQLNYRRPSDNRCQTCHSTDELWRFTHPPTLERRAGPWGEFYDQPWWFERRWQVDRRPAQDADSTTATESP